LRLKSRSTPDNFRRRVRFRRPPTGEDFKLAKRHLGQRWAVGGARFRRRGLARLWCVTSSFAGIKTATKYRRWWLLDLDGLAA